MGFPVGYAYADHFLPKFILYTIFLLGFIGKITSWLFHSLGIEDFLEPDIVSPEHSTHFPEFKPLPPEVLIREALQVLKFEDLITGDEDTPERCIVCLCEFDGKEEIRGLKNCKHIFHRSCLDRWMDYDQKTCPLCRTPFFPDDMQDAFGFPSSYGHPLRSVAETQFALPSPEHRSLWVFALLFFLPDLLFFRPSLSIFL